MRRLNVGAKNYNFTGDAKNTKIGLHVSVAVYISLIMVKIPMMLLIYVFP